jgi:hypothetical protein
MSYVMDPRTYIETRASLFGSITDGLHCDGCQDIVKPDYGCETPTGYACPECRTDFYLEA